jgi:hypothetical protein
MREFGASVFVYRIDGLPPSAEDERRVRAAAESLQSASPDSPGPYDGLNLQFGPAPIGASPRGLEVILTRYLVGDYGASGGPDPVAIVPREDALAEQFSTDLEILLGGGYRTNPYSGHL